MSVVLRSEKGSALTHAELDSNFSTLQQQINEKANTTHTHIIGDITNLQDELDNKIDRDDDVNVANGLLQLDANAKIPCIFLNDCFDVASKVSNNDLFDGNGKVKVELLPVGQGGGCDCVTIEADIDNLQTDMLGKVSTSALFDTNGKVKAELLPDDGCDCVQMATDIQNLQNDVIHKVTDSDLFDGNGKVKAELIPDDGCDCAQMTADIMALQNQKLNRLKSHRIIAGNESLLPIDDILIFEGVSALNLDGVVDGMSVKLRRLDSMFTVDFSTNILFVNGSNVQWDSTLPNTIELLFANNQWYQIG